MRIRISGKQFLRYSVMPGVRPRLQNLFFSGFSYIPYFIALVYQTVKLLPPGHAYLNPANIGRFGIRHVIAEAANHLTISARNTDQILLFTLILVALVIVFVQIILLGVALAFQPVFAGAVMPTNFTGFFITANPQQDLAMILLDLVFGVPNLFNSCVNQNIMCLDANANDIADDTNTSIFQPLGWPFPIHTALHAMFRIYSIGLLVVAALITCYFIATVVMETAQTGTPFGKRFNKLWAPIRIVVAFGLLIPLGTPGGGGGGGGGGAGGLNSAQYIVLYAAKFGSGFASNGWTIFNTSLTDTYVGQTQDLVSAPNAPEIGGILQFLYVASTCSWLEWYKNQRWIAAYVVRNPADTPSNLLFADIPSIYGAYGATGTYDYILNTFIPGETNVVIRFGVIDDTNAYKGFVKPICGEMVIPLTDPRPPGAAEPGTEVMQRYYMYVLQELWADVFIGNPPPGFPNAGTYGSDSYPANTAWHYLKGCTPTPACLAGYTPTALPSNEYRSDLYTFYVNDLLDVLKNSTGAAGLTGVVGPQTAVDAQIASGTWTVSPALADKGWAAAGLWYNKIAELNGAVTQSVASIPSVTRWPEVMEYVKLKKRQQDKNVPIAERFKPQLAGGKDIPFPKTYDSTFAQAMWEAFNYWQQGGFATTSHTQPSGNVFFDVVNAAFGTDGLYSMRRNPDVHPLAQLTGVGRSLVEASIRNLSNVTAFAAGGAVYSIFDSIPGGPAGPMIANIFLSIGMMVFAAGFILYYIVPFLPFLYFYFAVGGWLKAIFEAMVGLPLWALAHIRIDGNGLPGSAAVNGYFLIFEIFLRPILIVFGLLASISIFSAMVSVLNQVWELVTANVAGFDVSAEATGTGPSLGGFFRSALDEFFFTVIYAIIVYMMAMSSFKLIDLIPANILRWMGQSVATENDSKEDIGQNLISPSSVGASEASRNIGGVLQEGLGKVGAAKPQ